MSEETPSTPLDPTPQLPTAPLARPEVPPPPPLPPPPGPPAGQPPAAAPYYAAPPPPRPRSRTGLIVGIVSVVVFLVVTAIAIGVVFVGVSVLKRSPHRANGSVTASSTVTSTSGKSVFSDDFHDPSSGWTTNSLPSGTTFHYTAGGYVVVAKGTLDHFAESPYTTPVAQIAIAVTATQSADAPLGAGYGASCWQGSEASELRYDFVLTASGEWTVDRRDGGVLTKALKLRQGTSTSKPGASPLTITGVCATLADGHTVRLIMFAGSARIADITDRSIGPAGAGWQADLEVTSSEVHDSTVTVTRFEVRDLAH